MENSIKITISISGYKSVYSYWFYGVFKLFCSKIYK